MFFSLNPLNFVLWSFHQFLEWLEHPLAGLPGCPEMERTFGFWSVFNAILFLHCSIFLEEPPIFSMTVFSLTVYLAYFANEAFVHHSISRGGAALFPILLSGKYLWSDVRLQVAPSHK
ncbi:hypothetical protein IscW_ISCW000894 [Ixodes scapularis]|uniref:Ergosterol biosynthetic protein 28 n=1 Tax=Ixodes scapularis TaxID=6945 RepID=B7P5Z0_IXOSC|nr:hypothetical protein IscW_ISCW000894 [Ixodes scapularis]|eukprot:XP_002408102.1 hypothetical protein IscW_ISCW000894 [Ixodes scapularis]